MSCSEKILKKYFSVITWETYIADPVHDTNCLAVRNVSTVH